MAKLALCVALGSAIFGVSQEVSTEVAGSIVGDDKVEQLNSTAGWWDRYHHWHPATQHHHHYHHHHHHHGWPPRLEAMADDSEELNESGHKNLKWWDSHHHWHTGRRYRRRRGGRGRRYRRRHHHHHHHHHRRWPRLAGTVAEATEDSDACMERCVESRGYDQETCTLFCKSPVENLDDDLDQISEADSEQLGEAMVEESENLNESAQLNSTAGWWDHYHHWHPARRHHRRHYHHHHHHYHHGGWPNLEAMVDESEHLNESAQLNSTAGWWDRYHHWHPARRYRPRHYHHHHHHHHHHHGGWPRLQAVADDAEQLDESQHQNLTWGRRYRRRRRRSYRRRHTHHHHHHHHHHRHWPRLEDTAANSVDDATDGGIVMV